MEQSWEETAEAHWATHTHQHLNIQVASPPTLPLCYCKSSLHATLGASSTVCALLPTLNYLTKDKHFSGSFPFSRTIHFLLDHFKQRSLLYFLSQETK